MNTTSAFFRIFYGSLYITYNIMYMHICVLCISTALNFPWTHWNFQSIYDLIKSFKIDISHYLSKNSFQPQVSFQPSATEIESQRLGWFYLSYSFPFCLQLITSIYCLYFGYLSTVLRYKRSLSQIGLRVHIYVACSSYEMIADMCAMGSVACHTSYTLWTAPRSQLLIQQYAFCNGQ